MTKKDLVDKVAAGAAIKKTQAEKAIDSFVAAVKDSLKKRRPCDRHGIRHLLGGGEEGPDREKSTDGKRDQDSGEESSKILSGKRNERRIRLSYIPGAGS